MSKWENTLLGLQYGHSKVDHDSEDERDYRIKHYEVALKHDDTGAIVKLTDDGFIDIFASPETGIRIDPKTESVNLFGNNVNIIANNLNVRTKPHGFHWNGAIFNPELYAEKDGTMMEATSKVRYSEGMLDIMKELGLPVEEES